MDSASVASEHEVDSGVGSMNSIETSLYVGVTIPDLNIKKSVLFIPEESVWSAKQQIVSSLAKNLKDGFNYGLFIPSTNGKAGKFMDEGRLLKEYPLSPPLGELQFIRKRRIYKHTLASEKKMKQLHTKSCLRQLMDWVRKADVEKVVKVTNQGLDPNFIDHDSGETPLTLSISLEHPVKMVVSLVGGGAHLDYRNAKGLTAMHVASILGKEEGIKGLLDLGASTNYCDLQGLTPLYHCVCKNASTRCLEMLLYNHASVGTSDDSLWTELHQACKWGRIQLLELLIYYGANLNAQNSGGNTPLHICAVNSQEDCARVVLFRGADKTIKNFANHDAFETAIISGNASLAQIIKDFSSDDVVPYQDVPKLNERRRTSFPSTGTLQRWRSNPHVHLLDNEDQLSLRMPPAFRHEYDLTLPRDAGTAWGANQRVNRHRVSEKFGMKLNGCSVVQPVTSDQQKDKRHPTSNRHPLPRTVFLTPGRGGYGFILRGSRGSADDSNFVPSSEVPGLQYFSIIAQNSVAEQKGIKPKDFLLEVNGKNVRTASHDLTVNLIKQAKDILCLVVVSPLESPLGVKPDGSGIPHHNIRASLASHSIRQNSRSSGGLADLEALEKSMDANESGDINESSATHQRLLIAPNMQVLDRMAKTMAVGSGNGTASIHTTHGKRMAPAVALDGTYQDEGGLCRGRVSSLPDGNLQFRGISKSNSMHSLALAETMSHPNRNEPKIKPARHYIPKESALPPVHLMLSFPGSSGSDGVQWPGELDSSVENFQRNAQQTDGSISAHGPRSFRSPSLPLHAPLLPPPSRPPTPPPPPVRHRAGSVESSEESGQSGNPSSQPPPLPPLRPEPTTAPRSTASNKAKPSYNANKVPGVVLPLPPAPPFSPPAGTLPTSSKTISNTDNKPIVKETFHEDESQNPFLQKLRQSSDRLTSSSEYAMLDGDDLHFEQESPAPGNPFLLELQQKKFQMDKTRSTTTDVVHPHLDEMKPEAVNTSSSSSTATQEPFLNELLKALSTRPSSNVAAPHKLDSPHVSISTTGKLPVLPKQNVNEKSKVGFPASRDSAKSDEDSGFLLVKLQPVGNSSLGSRTIVHPPSVPPPPRLAKASPAVPFRATGFGANRSRNEKSNTSIDPDLPPPPPPPPPQEFGGHDLLVDDFLPLPPPPPMDF